jgi:hypothetical protein
MKRGIKMARRFVIIDGIGTTTTSPAKERSKTDIYAVPTGKILSIVSFAVHNNSDTPQYLKIQVGSFCLVGNDPIPAHDTLLSPSGFNLYLAEAENIIIQAEVNDVLSYRISGIEVDNL